MRRIVVGVDGSPGSELALAWALEEATEHDATIEAVTVCGYPDLVGVPGARFSAEPLERTVARARKLLDRVIDDVAASHPNTQIRPVVLPGNNPAHQLLTAAAGADLLVVGSRGLGGFRGLVLGSVSQQCISHAVCPTIVIPTPTQSAGAAVVDTDELEGP